jgi:hypothetical protein
MPNNRRSLGGAAFGALILGSVGAAAFAQETNTVGPPALKDFQLPGQRTTPPQPQPQPKAEQPARPAPPPPAASPPPARQPEPGAALPKAAAPRAERPAASAPSRTPGGVEPAPAPAIVLPDPQQAPALRPPAEAPAATPAASGWNPLWLALPAALALLGLGAHLRRRRRFAGAPIAREALAAAPEPQPRPSPLPAPAPKPVPSAAAAAGPRARLEIDFVPVRAAATDNEAVVHYDLVLRNAGEAPAGNIRIDTRMFNAGDERGIRAFLDGPIHDESGSPHVFVPPGGDMKLSSATVLPRAELREIELQGRRVFVPVVAVNVAYDWAGGGRGRTSRSWLVGREPGKPAAKMGPFRLDLGPRIYRSVGQRPTRLANVA